MQPVREVQEAVVHRDDEVGDQARDRDRPAGDLFRLDLDHLVSGPGAVLGMPVPDRAGEGRRHEAAGAGRIVQATNLQRHQALGAQVDRLEVTALLEVPDIQSLAVLPCVDVIELKAGLINLGRRPLTGDQDIEARLIPEVVHQRLRALLLLPAAQHLERLGVERREPARRIAVGIAQHAHHHDAAREAVRGVRPAVAGLPDDLLRLDHFGDLRLARIALHVQDVDPAGAGAGDHQVLPLHPMTLEGGTAGLPAVVVQLISGIWHRGAVNDLAAGIRVRVHVHDGQEIRLIDPGLRVAGAHVDELLARSLHSLQRSRPSRAFSRIADRARVSRPPEKTERRLGQQRANSGGAPREHLTTIDDDLFHLLSPCLACQEQVLETISAPAIRRLHSTKTPYRDHHRDGDKSVTTSTEGETGEGTERNEVRYGSGRPLALNRR